MSGPYTALHPVEEPAGVAYMRRASASFAGEWLNITVKNEGHLTNGPTAALYEDVFNSTDILWAQPVIGCPSVYRLGLNTASGTYSESFLSADVQAAVGVVGGVDPIAGKYVLPHGVVAALTDPWAVPVTY